MGKRGPKPGAMLYKPDTPQRRIWRMRKWMQKAKTENEGREPQILA